MIMERRIVPVRDIQREASASGPVQTYQLSEEELARYRAMPGPDGKGKKPVQFWDDFASRTQARHANKKQESEEQTTMSPKPILSRQELLERIAAGKSLADIEREQGMKHNSIYALVKTYDLKGITPGKARELLATSPNAPDDRATLEQRMKDYQSQAVAGWAEAERLQEELKAASSKQEEHVRIIDDLRMNLAQQQQANAELLEERKQLLQQIEERTHSTAGVVECIDAIEAATVGLVSGQAYITGSAIESLWHWNRKGGIEGLRKARLYIDRLIEEAAGH